MRLDLAEGLQIPRERWNLSGSEENFAQETFPYHFDSERVANNLHSRDRDLAPFLIPRQQLCKLSI